MIIRSDDGRRRRQVHRRLSSVVDPRCRDHPPMRSADAPAGRGDRRCVGAPQSAGADDGNEDRRPMAAGQMSSRDGDRGPNGSSSRSCSRRPPCGVVTTIGIVVVLAVPDHRVLPAGQPDRLPDRDGLVGVDPALPFGVLALVSGTLLVAGHRDGHRRRRSGCCRRSCSSEYASNRIRNTVKPVLETIAGIPTIVLGFFAINFLTPDDPQAAHSAGHRARSPRWRAGSSSASSSRR